MTEPPSTVDAGVLARELDAARRTGREVERLTLAHPSLSMGEAYAVMDAGIALRQTEGERVIGLKMGLTSEAKRRQMGLDAPIYGVLTDAMLVQNVFRLAGALHPKIEPEIAFRFEAELRGRPDRRAVLAACTGVCAAMEILDSRYRDFKYFSLPDVVADNASSSHFVLSQTWSDPAGLQLTELLMEMSVNGEVRQSARANAISGDPVRSVVQLCELLDGRGRTVPAGSIVLAGAATVAEPLHGGEVVELRVERLAPVRIRVDR